MKVQPDGSSSLIPVKTTEPYSSASTTRRLLPGEVVPDNNGALLVAYSYSSPGPEYSYLPSLAKEARIAKVAGTTIGPDYALAMGTSTTNAWIPEDWDWFAERSIVLGDNSTGFAVTDYSSLTAGDMWVDQVVPNKVVSFNVETGAVNWTWQPPQGSVELVSATEGGGVVIRLASAASPRWLANQVVRLDSTGQATYDPWTAQDPQYFARGWTARGSYVSLEAETVAPPLSVWLLPMGDAQSQRLAIKQTTLKVIWCGTGYGRQGTEGVCTGHAGVTFGYADNPDPQTQLQDFSAAHPDWVDVVENEAQDAFKKAFRFYPAVYVVPRGSTREAEHIAVINGDFLSNYANGMTPPAQHSMSLVYYAPVLLNAEIALGPGGGSARFVPQSDADYRLLMAALGRGIGNVSAHEAGHQLILPGMDCGDPDVPLRHHCEGGTNYVYNFFSSTGFPQDSTNPWSTGGQFFYLPNIGIGWTKSAACALWDIGPRFLQSPTCPQNP